MDYSSKTKKELLQQVCALQARIKALKPEQTRKTRAGWSYDNLKDGPLSHFAGAVVVLNPDATVRYFNPAFEKLTGYKLDQLIDRKLPYRWWLGKGTDASSDASAQLLKVCSQPVEELIQKRDGTWFWVEVTTTAIRQAGRLECFVGDLVDITARKRLEQTLEKRDRLNDLLLDALPHPAMLIRKGGEILATNAAARRVGAKVGGICWRDFARSEFIPESDKKYINEHKKVPPGGTRCVFCLAEEALETQKPTGAPEICIWGKIWDMHWVPLDDQTCLHYGVDVTTIKQAEASLRRAEQEKSLILNTMSELVVFQDAEMRILWANRAACESVSLPLESMVGRHCYDVWHGRTGPCEKCPVVRARRTGRPCEGEVVSPDGRIWFIWAYPVKDEAGRIERVVEVAQNITDVRKVERKLAESEQKYRRLVATTSDAVMLFDAKTLRFIEVNRAAQRLYGYSREEFLRLDVLDITAEPDETQKAIQKLQRGVRQTQILMRLHKRKDGTTFPVEITGSIFELGGRRVISGIVRDIAKRVRAEKELRAQRDLAQKYLDVAAVMFVALDADGRVSLINKKGCEILGYPEKDIIGKNWFENFLPAAERRAVWVVFNKLMAGRVKPVEYSENPIITREGQHRVIAWHNTLLRDDSGRAVGVLSSGLDVTERRKAEQVVRDYQSQLKAMATELTMAEERQRRELAVGLHDDIAQRLALVQVQLQSAMRSVADKSISSALDKVRAEIHEVIERTGSLTFELANPVLYELGLAVALEQYLKDKIQAEHGIGYSLVVDSRLGRLDNELAVALFRIIRELLMNVVRHARAGQVEVALARRGKMLRVRVKDDGVGFDPSESLGVSKSGEGGFGLFSIREHLDYLGGTLGIDSAQGKGTCVTVTVPVVWRNEC